MRVPQSQHSRYRILIEAFHYEWKPRGDTDRVRNAKQPRVMIHLNVHSCVFHLNERERL